MSSNKGRACEKAVLGAVRGLSLTLMLAISAPVLAVVSLGDNVVNTVAEVDTKVAVKADIASPEFTGTPKVPTKSTAATNDGTLVATEAQVYLKANIASPTFTGTPKVPSKTIAATNTGTLIATEAQVYRKADIESPTFTGTPTAPTADAGTNTTQIATTAFVAAATVASSATGVPVQVKASSNHVSNINNNGNGIELNAGQSNSTYKTSLVMNADKGILGKFSGTNLGTQGWVQLNPADGRLYAGQGGDVEISSKSQVTTGIFHRSDTSWTGSANTLYVDLPVTSNGGGYVRVVASQGANYRIIITGTYKMGYFENYSVFASNANISAALSTTADSHAVLKLTSNDNAWRLIDVEYTNAAADFTVSTTAPSGLTFNELPSIVGNLKSYIDNRSGKLTWNSGAATTAAVTLDPISKFGGYIVGVLTVIQHNAASANGGAKTFFVQWNGSGSASATMTQMSTGGANFTATMNGTSGVITLTPTVSANFTAYLDVG